MHLIFIQVFFFMLVSVHQRDKQQTERQEQETIKPQETGSRGGRRERESAESDQYSNSKMNLTGARTSHQMGKEIGYER